MLIPTNGKLEKLTIEIETDPIKYSAWVIASVGSKADKYKKLSRRYSSTSVLLSSLVVFSLIFEGASPATILAGSMTILNSVLLAWFQLEKPYDRWRLYRKFHRRFESERTKYLNEISPYDIDERGKKLMETLSDLQIILHNEWEGLIPSTEEIKKIQRGS